ncbi:unnamed protein product [Phytophthora lilii]|uniref:Unnamed protein product n=1 Tax=Phytophthora lilii TaxID=2077276 RepID=A0A9W7CQT7_9STRA|nr:unnamed protein product [Phytophthora lilii]
MQLLLELVWQLLPSKVSDWEAVAAAYNVVKESQWKSRDCSSLKRKFRSMCLISKQAETAHAIDTRQVQSNISQATVTKRDNVNKQTKLWHFEVACADGHDS